LVRKEIAKRQLHIGVKSIVERTDRGPAPRPYLLKQRMNEKMVMGWIGTADKAKKLKKP